MLRKSSIVFSPHINLRIIPKVQRLARSANHCIASNQGMVKQYIIEGRIAADDGVPDDGSRDRGVFPDGYIRSNDTIAEFAVLGDADRINDHRVF